MKTNLKSIQRQYRQLASKLAQLSWIARGNTFRRFLVRRVGGKDTRCGPYYLLTRKQDARTITHALNQPQFNLYSQAIREHHLADQILKKMRKLTVQFIQASTPPVPSRKRSRKPLS
jgi:cell division protein YceG involved in septum cleavage